MEKAVTEMELAIRRKQGSDEHAEAIKQVLTDLGKTLGTGLETVQKQAEQPVNVTVTNEVQTPEVNVDVKAPEVSVTNEVQTPEVSVMNEVKTPEVNVDVTNEVQTPEVNVDVKAPEVTVEGSKIDVPPIEVPAAEVTVNLSKDECPTRAEIEHPGGRLSHVRLLKDGDE
jgi:hypothetical protein